MKKEIINGEELFFVLTNGNEKVNQQIGELTKAGLVHCGWSNDYNFMVFRRNA